MQTRTHANDRDTSKTTRARPRVIARPGKAASSGAEPRHHVTRLMDGYVRTQLLYMAARLGIADILATGPLSSEEISRAVGAEAIALHRVLRGLVFDGVLSEQEDGRFGLTPAGELLRSDAPGSVHGAVIARGDIYYAAAAGLLHAVQHGGSAFEHVYGKGLFDYLSQHPEKGADFQRSMLARAHQEAADAISVYDFSPFRRAVDVGGGYGILLSEVLRATPALHGVLFDLPPVVARAAERLGGADLRTRSEIIGGDFFQSVPAGGDLYILSRVIHDWDDAASVRILANCHAAIPEGGTLLLVEAVLPERACDQPGAIQMDLHMLTLLHGRERTAAEYRTLLAASGFELNRVIPTLSATGLCVLEARRVAAPEPPSQ
jgi:hypothetical protein